MAEDTSTPVSGLRFSPAARRAAHLLVLWAFAVAQPLYDLVGRNATFLVAHRLTGVQLPLLVVAFSLALPALLLLLCFGLGRIAGDRVRDFALDAFALTLAGLLALSIAKHVAWISTPARLAAATVVPAFLLVLALRRSEMARSFFDLLSLSVILFPALFLARDEVSRLILPHRTSAFPKAAIHSSAPIVMIVFDELSLASLLDPNEHIDASRYPNLADLASRSHWFRNATTVSWRTEEAVPALLTGLRPRIGSLPTIEDHPANLFTWLSGSYRIHASEALTRLCPDEICRETEGFGKRLGILGADSAIVYLHAVLPAALTAKLPSVESSWKGFATGGGVGSGDHELDLLDRGIRFRQFLNEIDSESRPTFHFLHVLLPHVPYRYLPSGKRYGPFARDPAPHGLLDERWSSDEWEAIQGHQRYLLQLAFVDRLVGEVVSRLEQRDLFDRSLVVMTSDHGVSFVAGEPRRALTEANLGSIVPVLLLVKSPGQAHGLVSDRNVESVDVAPTIAAALGEPLPWASEGSSALDDAAPARVGKSTLKAGLNDWLALPDRIDALATAAHSQWDRFGALNGLRGIYEIGVRREWLGREVGSELSSLDKESLEIELEEPGALVEYRAESSLSPTHVIGALHGTKVTLVNEIGFVVNGRLESLTHPFGPSAERRVTSMLPETAFRPGLNRIQAIAFLSGTDSAAPVWAPVRAERAQPYSLISQGFFGQAVIDQRGATRPIKRAHRQGFVESVRRSSQTLWVSGWAADPAAGTLPERILVFADGELVREARTTRARPDVARGFGKAALLLSGFDFRVPLEGGQTGGSDGVRVIALMPSGAALELPRVVWQPSHQREVVDCDGFSFPVETDALTGAVDSLTRSGDWLLVEGWGAAKSLAAPASRFILLDRGICVHAGPPNFVREDIAKFAGTSALARSGIRWFVPLPRGESSESREQFKIFAVDRVGKASELRMEGPAPGVRRQTVEVIRGCEGEQHPVDRQPKGGFLDTIEAVGDLVRLEGWAANRTSGDVAREVLIFSGSRCLGWARPGQDRPDVAAATGHQGLRHSGFRAYATLPGAQGSRLQALRLFAIDADGVATELERSAEYPQPRAPAFEVLLGCDGEPYAVEPDGMDGALDRIERRDGTVRLLGWAADRTSDEPARMVMLVRGRRCLQATRLGFRRDDLANRTGRPRLAEAGFYWQVQEDVVAGSGANDIRLVAVGRDRAAVEIVHSISLKSSNDSEAPH